jgi:hypothetical protein
MSSGNGTGGPETPGATEVPPTLPDEGASEGAGLGDALEALVKMAGDKSPGATPAQLKAWADLLSSFLSAPAVTTWAQAWGAAKQAEAAARVELAKQQGQNADAAHKRQTEVATTFLKSLAILGVAGMAFLAALAWWQVLDKQAFGVLASTFFTALFGTGIYGTAMKNRS